MSDPVAIKRIASRRSPAYWLGLLLLFNFVVVGATVILVRGQPLDAAGLLVPPPNCSDPCWQGIQPGITRITSAQSLLHDSGINFKPSSLGPMGTMPVQAPRGWLVLHLNSGFDGFKVDNTITSICLSDSGEPEGSLLLGDVLAALGTPDEVRLRRPEGTTVRVMIRYRSRQVEAAVVLPIRGARLTPLTPVDILCFLPKRMFAYDQPEASDLALDWRGIASILHYYAGPPFT